MDFDNKGLRFSKRKRVAAVCVLAVLALACAGFGTALKRPLSVRRDTFAMGTLVRISVCGRNKAELEAAAAAAEAEISRLEELFSVHIASSEIARINADPEKEGGHTVSAETYGLLKLALKEAEETGGAFDPTIGAVVSLWGVGSERARVPDGAEIQSLLDKTGWAKVRLWQTSNAAKPSETIYRVSAGGGQKLDLGAIAKGCAADGAARVLRGHGVKSALINIGGDLTVLGKSPRGRDWRLGLQLPDGPHGEYFAVLAASDAVIITSGAYERYFERDGVRYHHIFDTKTGRPAKSDLVSVTIVMGRLEAEGNAARCDALATALFVMGFEKARAFLRAHPEVQAVLAAEGGEGLEVFITEGLKNRAELSKGTTLKADAGEKR